MDESSCIVCDAAQLRLVLEFGPVPLHCNLLLATADAARAVPSGTIQLAFCPDCGHLFNRSFDPARLSYDADYETSQHFSPRFRRYAEELADRLIARYGLRGKTAVEIGCGQGDFLALLCERGGCQGLGFDQSYAAAADGRSLPEAVSVSRETAPPQAVYDRADLVICRHVLEHLAEPHELVAAVRRGIGDRPETVVYFEVPNALFTLRELGIWDLIYEHCSYFTAASLSRLLEDGGLSVASLVEAFGGQFLAAEASPTACRPRLADPRTDVLAETAALVGAFPARLQATLKRWRTLCADLTEAGQRVAVWGAGSKGVTFVNLVAQEIRPYGIVDLNPRKQGRFVPGTASPVLAPAALRSEPPDVIIVMNPIYETEVRRESDRLGLGAQVMSVG